MSKLALTDIEKETLIILAEECGELIQACMKLLRNEYLPEGVVDEDRAVENFSTEYFDVIAIARIAELRLDHLLVGDVQLMAERKIAKLRKYSNIIAPLGASE